MITVHKACILAQMGRDLFARRCIQRFMLGIKDPETDLFSLLYSVYWDNRYFKDQEAYRVVGYILETPEIVSYFSRDDWFKGHYLTILQKTRCHETTQAWETMVS